ncbi:hypothetical protein WMY93_022915 [Mugilogobius chulae]|uniref:Uncharacterized protein n=1 Tax=Mugilogobius chulae TaxID=88201 RepID=A0AAW0N7A2_9GOBI
MDEEDLGEDQSRAQNKSRGHSEFLEPGHRHHSTSTGRETGRTGTDRERDTGQTGTNLERDTGRTGREDRPGTEAPGPGQIWDRPGETRDGPGQRTDPREQLQDRDRTGSGPKTRSIRGDAGAGGEQSAHASAWSQSLTAHA